MFEKQFQEYPDIVRVRTKYTVNKYAYSGGCKVNYWGCEIETGPYENIFRHEMGHAVANILEIEQELGKMVFDLGLNRVVTSDNIFSYGAQIYTLKGYRTAIKEYAAIAIDYYYTEKHELPQNIIEFLDSKLN